MREHRATGDSAELVYGAAGLQVDTSGYDSVKKLLIHSSNACTWVYGKGEGDRVESIGEMVLH